MKNVRNLFSLCFLLLWGMNMFAANLMGGSLNYFHNTSNPCQYLIRFHGYYDCAGGSPSNPVININGGSGCIYTLTLPTLVSSAEVTPVCPGTVTQCTNAGSAVPGVREYIYDGYFTACGLPCTRFALSYSECCRSGAILNLLTPSTKNTFIRTDTIDTGFANSSPESLNNPIVYLCAGQNATHSLAFQDLENDSLSYFLVACKSATTGSIPYNTGYSVTSPLGTGWGVTLNSTSGHLTFTAQTGAALGTYALAFQIDQYRNNVKIGSSTHEMTVSVVNCNSGGINCCNADFTTSVNASTATFTNLSGSTATSYVWNFGDGGTSTAFSPTHTYTSAGTYLVSLAISSASGCTDTVYNMVKVYTPQTTPPPVATYTYMAMGNGLIQFTGTASGGVSPYTYLWNFGNNTTSSFANPTCQYTSTGVYNVCFTVTDAMGQSNTTCQSITINLVPPPLSVTLAYTTQANGNVVFTCTTGNGVGPYMYSWDFGDGTNVTNALATMNHQYATSGTYNVCVYVTDANGTTGFSCQNVTVVIPPTSNCYAGYTYSSSSVVVPVAVSFVADSISSSFVYNWDFGDGSTGSGSSNVHTYVTSGVYTVCLIVTQPGTTCADTFCTGVSIGIGIDLNGYIFAGSAVDSFEVYLIQHDTTGGGTLTAIDTQMVWGAPAYYSFTNQDPSHIYFTKAAMKAGTINYANYMPTYYDTALMWSNAHPIVPMSMPPFPANFDIYMQIGTNSGGPGFIGGLISQGANKITNTASENTEVMLWDMNNDPVAYTYTDANGNFSFSNLAYGTYKIYPEMLNKTTFPKIVTISGNIPNINNIEMLVQYDSIYDITSALAIPAANFASFKAYPNPTNDKLSLEMDLKENTALTISLLEVNGKVIFEKKVNVNVGKHLEVLNLSNIANGMYFLKVSQENGENYLQKVIKQ